MSESKQPTIVVKKNMPYKVSDLQHLTGSDGQAIETSATMFLCKCGLSQNKPFCDGSHVSVGLDSEKCADRVKDRVIDYKAKEQDVIIHDNRGVCSHDGSCLKDLPGVFKKDQRRWIDPDGASAEEIIALIKKCPSGALSATINGVHYDSFDREATITMVKDGPLDVSGGVVLEDESGCKPQSPEHYALCRCGHSKNKPFCDGHHKEFGFTD